MPGTTTHHPAKLTVGLLITQGHWGGAQRYVFDLATGLAREMHVVVGVGSPHRNNELQERLTMWNNAHPEAPVEIQQLNHLVREIAPWHDVQAIFEVRRFITRNQLHILHCNSAKAMVIGTIAHWGLRLRRVVTVHGFTFTEPLSILRTAFYRALERMAIRTADLTICPDRTSYTIARDTFHVPEHRIAHIPHTISEPAFLSRKDARAELARRSGLHITDQTRIVGSVANFYRVKNQALLLESFEALASKDPNVVCIIIGDGQERTALEEQRARMHCADRIFFPGAQENAATLLRGFDTFVLTSDKEGYPYVLLEARAAGIPIVSRAVGGCKEILEGVPNAQCISEATPDAIATALHHALAQPHVRPDNSTGHHMHEVTRDWYNALITN